MATEEHADLEHRLRPAIVWAEASYPKAQVLGELRKPVKRDEKSNRAQDLIYLGAFSGDF